MTINIDNIAVIEKPLSPDDRFAAEIDISTWLDSDTISAVAYTATNGTGTDATANVLDTGKSTNTQTVIKPYLKGYTSGGVYTAKCKVTTTGGDVKVWYVVFECKEYAA